MIFILIGILLFVAVLYWDVHSDAKRLSLGKTINHNKELLVRTLLLTPAIFFLTLYNFSIIHIPITIFMVGAWWWEFFDGWLNLKRDKPWRYNGSDDEDDAHTDDFLQGLRPNEQGVLKWGLIIIFTILYFAI